MTGSYLDHTVLSSSFPPPPLLPLSICLLPPVMQMDLLGVVVPPVSNVVVENGRASIARISFCHPPRLRQQASCLRGIAGFNDWHLCTLPARPRWSSKTSPDEGNIRNNERAITLHSSKRKLLPSLSTIFSC